MRALDSTHLNHALLALLALFSGLQSCQAPAPRSRAESVLGAVRAESQELADQVADMVDELHPRVAAFLPDARQDGLDVWVQEEPMLYRFLSGPYEEADGFWAELPARIHLRRGADDLRRTLAHELTHATLGPTWRFLPGTIEEGLCDLVSAKLCPESAPTMRAGRLSAASFAIGGLELELGLTTPDSRDGTLASYSARILLQSGGSEPLDPMEVFEVRAGLSTTALDAPDKKAFYGLSYIVVDRIVTRYGLGKLHELCLRAETEKLEVIPAEWLLEAAELDGSRETWRNAIAAALGEAELVELVEMYPRFIAEALEACKRSFAPVEGTGLEESPDSELWLSLSLPASGASILLSTKQGAAQPLATARR